jgi:hypothetical protein
MHNKNLFCHIMEMHMSYVIDEIILLRYLKSITSCSNLYLMITIYLKYLFFILNMIHIKTSQLFPMICTRNFVFFGKLEYATSSIKQSFS